MTVRVLLADDQVAVREGLKLLLNAFDGIEVVGEAGDGAAAVTMARALRPHVVLMDARMPRMDGVEATRQIVAEGLAEVLMLTTFSIDEYIFGALRAGARGFLLKDVPAATLVDGIRQVAAGHGMIAPEVTRRMLDEFVPVSPGAPPAQPGLGELTDRERGVLGCLGEGLSNAEIARRLGLGEATVKTYVSRIHRKLRVGSRMQAAVIAREQGITSPAAAARD